MSLKAEVLADRRLLQRRLSFWRFIALAVVAVFVVIFVSYKNGTLFGQPDHIARLTITGVISDDRAQQELLKKLGEDKNVKAVIISINSPGGTTSGGEALFESIRDVADKKPVVAVFGTMATSAAYIAGMATDHIVARGNTITGSVGVIFQWAEVSKLMETLGIKFEEIKSGPLKANPSPFQPTDEAGRKLAQEMVAESHQWFLNIVKTRRNLDASTVPGLADGRIFSGRQALALKLVDQIGGEEKAIQWIESKKDMPKGLKVIDWEVNNLQNMGFLKGLAFNIATSIGIPEGITYKILNENAYLDRVRLDGLVSVWQP